MSVFRIYVEKKPDFAVEARAVLKDLQTALRCNIFNVRIMNRYDVDHISEEAFKKAIPSTTFTPICQLIGTTSAILQLNICRDSLTSVQTAVNSACKSCWAVNAAEYVPHKFIS